jgi:sugar phosphate isomerase/epimerase
MIDMSKDIVINLLAFADAVGRGSRQVDCFSEVALLGVKKVEVRREWIKDFTKELPAMHDKAEELGLEIYYSIPGVLFKAGKLERDGLQQIFQEARILGATRVKFAVGQFDANDQVELLDLKKIVSEHTILVTVEGDQSPANGRLEPILALMDACRTNNIPVYTTFDVGNFIFVGQEPLYNAMKLSSHVRYIHLKDVEMTPQGPQVRRLDRGHINWRAVLSLLPKDVPMGIEFPCGQEPRELLLQTIEQIQEVNES